MTSRDLLFPVRYPEPVKLVTRQARTTSHKNRKEFPDRRIPADLVAVPRIDGSHSSRITYDGRGRGDEAKETKESNQRLSATGADSAETRIDLP